MTEFRVSAALCSTAETKAAELGAQNPGGGISHGPELDTLGEGENLYTGWSSVAMTVTQRMNEATDLWQNEKQWWTYGDINGQPAGGQDVSNHSGYQGLIFLPRVYYKSTI